MTRLRFWWLVAAAWCRLAWFDVARALLGRTGLERGRSVATSAKRARVSERELLNAMQIACCLYWKPVWCLQRSACTVRLLRAHHVKASLVIGCRAKPFVSHAWVEIDGRVANDSPAYAERLQVLYVV